MAFKGLDTFTDVVEILRDSAKYDSKVKELKQLIAQYTEAVESVVALANVNDYTQNIKVREEESKRILENAKADAEAIKMKAKQDAEAKAIALKEREIILNKAENDLAAKEALMLNEVTIQASEAKALLSWKEELDKRSAKLIQDEAEVAERLAKLKSVMA